jgi:hypothetical protein
MRAAWKTGFRVEVDWQHNAGGQGDAEAEQ